MESFVTSTSLSITQNNVLYVGQQINLDLQALSKAYPRIIPLDYAVELFNSYTIFLYNTAVSDIGFSIYDPANENLVYHENRYKIVLGIDVRSVTMRENRGIGGAPVERVWVPSSAAFTPWVIWSSTMLNSSKEEQRRIVSGTKWLIPGEGSTFKGKYEGGIWSSLGLYGSGDLGVEGQVWKI